MLRGFLNFQRDTLLWKTDGLTAQELRQTLPPSQMTLGGMLKHLALVETHWFSEVFLGEPALTPFDTVDWSADVDWDWNSATYDSPDELRELLEQAVAASDAILEAALAGGGLDQITARRHHLTGEHWSLRWVLLHMIEEYARHLGHADLIRESIDGMVGE